MREHPGIHPKGIRRQGFFQSDTEPLLEHKDKRLHLAVGDFNTGLHARQEGEERVIGNYVWGRGPASVKKMPPWDKEQGQLLVAALKALEHVHPYVPICSH